MMQIDLPVAGRVNCLVVDLCQGGRVLERDEDAHLFLGGRGLGVSLLAELGNPAWDPLDVRQPFILSAGPLTGTRAPSSGRFSAVAASPLTGTAFESNAGGRLGARLRAAGLSALAVVGECDEWSVLVVEGRTGAGRSENIVRVKLLPVSRLLPEFQPEDPGLTSSQVTAGLRKVLGSRFSFVFPGVAGRRGAMIACVRTDERRSLGRGGLGLTLGSRRLFAIAVAGDGEKCQAGTERQPDRERLEFVMYEAQKLLDANPVTSQALPQFGTAVLMQLVNQAGALPSRNYRDSYWAQAEAVSGEALRDQLVTARTGCFRCKVRCTGLVGKGSSAREAPEYETLWALGADCCIDDVSAIHEANVMCGELGIDTISTGATIACAMELSDRGALGRSIRFGDKERMLDLVGKMGRVEDFGVELAQGSARLAGNWGHPHLSMHVKGLEMPGYDPRGMQGQGLGYATCNRGGCHLGGNMLGPEILGIPKLVDRFSNVGKSGILINLQHMSAVFDSVCMCKFAGFAFGDEVVARLLSAAWDTDFSAQDLLQAGERIWNLERLWNLAAGFTRLDDTLPDRLLHEPAKEGPSAGRVVNLEPMLNEYYRARGWSREGIPGKDKLKKLNLAALSDRLAQAGATGAAGEREAQVESSQERRRHLRAV